MAKKGNNWARLVGHGLAHVQNGFDFAADLGFVLLKKAGKGANKPPKKDENKYVYQAKRTARNTMRFLGILGDEYYKKYEELKADKAEEEA